MATRTIHVLRWPVLDDGRVQALAKSIESLGLLQGVVVREPTEEEQKWYDWDGSHYIVVAGFHRAAAWRRLNRGKLDGIPVLMVNPGVDDELVEIDENLVRAHLDGAALAELTARRLARAEAGPGAEGFSVTVTENPNTDRPARNRGTTGKRAGRPARPAVKDTADALGVAECTVRRRARRAAGGESERRASAQRRFKILLDLDDSESFCRQLEMLTRKMTPEARRHAAEIFLRGL